MCIEHVHTCVRLIIRVQILQYVGGRTCNDVTCINVVLSLQCRSVVGLRYELDHICELSVNEERCQFHRGIKTVFAAFGIITSLP